MSQTLAMTTRGKQGLTDTEISYLAGVIDSDGCIAISKCKPRTQGNINPRYVLYIRVVNTSEDLMMWLLSRFGGTYNSRKRQSKNHKIIFNWTISNGRCLWLLKLIEKYMVVKKEQVLNAIDLLENWETRHFSPKSKNGARGFSTSQKEVERREKCYQKMKQLNQVGPVQPQRLSVLAPVL